MQPGELIADRFRLDAAVGAGAMGVVFRASDLAAGGQPVAVKALRHDSQSHSQRFLRETAALVQLRHPALVRYVAHGLTAGSEPYLAMEWIEGPTLADQLASSGLAPLASVRLALRVLDGLTALHAAGIVHRDLKPSNLMLPGGDPAEVRILDLGVARFADASVELTQEGSALGTPRYMAPEQVRDARRVDGRADVFALGCVLFECLTGARAFPGEDPIAVLAQILFGHPSAPSELRPELPEPLDRVLARMLARSPELRPGATDLALRAQLSLLLEGALGEQLGALPGCKPRPHAPQPSDAYSDRTVDATVGQADTLPEASRVRLSAPPPLQGRARKSVVELAGTAAARTLIGRERELRELLAALFEGRPVTLWGGPGVGKTRLAQEVMLQAVARGMVPERAVLFCDLSSARDSRDIVRLCAEQLGLSHIGPAEGDVEDQAGRLFAKLGSILIVLDRAEHLRRELEPLIALWSERAPELLLLVTSRVRLRGTREHALGPLPHRARAASGVRALPLGTEPAQPLTAAAEFVLTLARAAWPDGQPAPDATTPQQAEDIASALDGNPLAIELALARLPLLGFAGILERLSAQLALLSEETRDNTMRKALEWSWDLLSPAQRSAFMQCSVFCAAFSLQAAEAVIALPQDAGSTLDVLQALREQSLLGSRSEGQGQVRLSMPAVVRELAREELARASEHDPSLAEVAERHARYVAAQVGAEPRALELDDVVAAAEHSLSRRDAASAGRALALVLTLERPLLAAGSGSQLAALLERALAAVERCGAAGPAEHVLLSGQLLRARLLTPAGEREQALRDLQHVLERAEALGERQLWATAMLDLGVTYHFARELDRAEAAYERALDVLLDLDDPIAEARCHGNLGAVQHDRAQLTAAADGYRRALALLPTRGQERLLANFKGNLALVEHELGAVHSARQLYAEAAALLEQLLDARLLGIVLGNLGTLELTTGQHTAALECFTRAARLLEQCGDRRSEGLSLARLAACLAQAGHVPEAEQRCVRAERLLRKDSLGRPVVELLSGFIDLELAKRAAAAGQDAVGRARLTAARAKCERARSVEQPSDDLRLFLGLLEPQLTDALRSDRHSSTG